PGPAPVLGRRPAGRLRLAGPGRRGLAGRGPPGRHHGLRRRGPRHLPGLRDLDGHGARPGDPPGGAVRAAAVPRRAVGPARRAAHGDGGARARRRARRRGGLADRLGRHGRGGPPARRVRPGSGGDRMTGLHTPTRPGTDRPQGGARGTWALRDRTATVWLAAAVVVALVHPFVPGSRWLMVHLVLLGALTHSIMVWTHHFAQAILKTPPGLDDRARQSR